MKRLALVLVAIVLVTAADDVKTDKEKLKGEWKVASAEREGKEVEQIKDADLRLKFDGDKFTISFNGQEFEGSYKIDPTKKPKIIDTTVMDQERLGIYELDGDTLKICRGEPGEERPKEFKTKEGTRNLLTVSKRQKKE